jgi:hypothetical protein
MVEALTVFVIFVIAIVVIGTGLKVSSQVHRSCTARSHDREFHRNIVTENQSCS